MNQIQKQNLEIPLTFRVNRITGETIKKISRNQNKKPSKVIRELIEHSLKQKQNELQASN